jgi:hypothetical protein
MQHRRIILALLVLSAAAAGAVADDGAEIDVDAWHRQLAEAIGPEAEEPSGAPAFGIFPSAGVVLGPPNWASLQAHAYVSYTDGARFSLYGGLGIERGATADAIIVTFGWGGVRRLPAAVKQLGFHGKYLRYREWDHDEHGRHRGLSVGTESALGNFALAFELGAARSQRNHWIVTAQVCVKIGVPVYLPLEDRASEPASRESPTS